MSKKLSKKELENILAEVEVEIAGLLKSQTADLKKAVAGADEDPAASAPEASPAEGSAPPAPEASPAEGSAPEASPAEGSAPEAPPAEGSAPAPEAPEAPGAEGGGDLGSLEQEYAKLPLEELKAHYLAAKAALFAQMQQGGPAEGSAPPAPEAPPAEGSAPAPSGPPAPEASPAEEPAPAMKAELPEQKSSIPCCGTVKGSGERSPSVAKSEKEIKELRDQLETLTKAVTILVEQPMRKAVTGLSFVSKEAKETKPLSKSEVTEILKKKTLDPTLSKSDRKLVTDFYEGNVSLEKIAHLLK